MINQHLSHIDWDYEFRHLDVDAMYSLFLEIVHHLVAEYIPNPCGHNNNPPWLAKPPPALKRRRCRMWKHYKTVRSQTGRHSAEANVALQQYLDVNYQYRTFVINKQHEYEHSLVDNMVHDSKLFHSYIRSKKVAKVGVGPLKTPEGQIVSDPTMMANMFAAAFSSVFFSGYIC